MALIKKYNAGGSFKDYLENRLLSDTSAPKEVYDNIGTIDPENPDSYAGYSDRVKGYISNSYADYQKQQENRRTHKITFDDVHKRDLDFSDFIKRRHGSLENFFEKVDQYKTKDEAKKFLYNEASELSNIFKKEYGDNPNDNWERAGLLQSWSNSLGDGSDYLDRWDNMTSEAKKLGWDFDYFLPSDDQYKEWQLAREQQARAQEQQNRIDTNIQNLINIGFDPELAANYIRSGYKLSDGKEYEEYGFLDKLREGGYNLITDATNTNNFLVKDGQRVKEYGDWISDDILNKYYGYSYGVGSDGTFKIYKPEEYASNTNVNLWEDYNDEKLELTPENNPNPNHKWYSTSADDFQGNFHKNILGLRDLLGQITRIDTRTGGKEIYDRNENGEYVDSKGNKVEIPNWVSYVNKGQVKHSLDKYFKKNKNSPLYGITGKEAKNGSLLWKTPRNIEDSIKMIDDVKAEVKRIQDAGDTTTKNKYRKNLSDSTRHIYYLAEKAEAEGNFDDVDKYLDILTEVVDIMGAIKPEEEGGEGIPIMRGTTFNKEGGVLKAQDGSTLEKLYKQSTQNASQAPSFSDFNQDKINPGKVKFLNKTMSEMDALDALSLAGNIASVIPVIGGFGAAATTAIDIARGLKKDKWEREDTLNLLSNLGFTALSFAGLGGARALKVGAQAAKGSGRFAKLAKSAKGAVKITPTPFGAQVAKGAEKIEKTLGKSDDVTRLVELAKGADTIDDVAKIGASADDLRLLQQIAGRRHNWVQSAGIAGAKGIGRGAQKVGDLISNPGVGKWVGYGLKANTGYQGVMGGLNVAENIAEADGNIFQKIKTGIGDTEQTDIKNILFAGGLGANESISKFRTYAAKRNIRPVDGSGTKATTTLKIGDQTFQLNKTAEKGKALKSLKHKDLKDALSKKESKKLLESLSTEDLENASQAKEFQKILDALKPAKEGAKVKVPKVTLSQNKSTGFKYELSEHALDKSGQKSYGWWDNVLYNSASKSWNKGLSGIYGKTYKWNNTPIQQTQQSAAQQPAVQTAQTNQKVFNSKVRKTLNKRNKIRNTKNKTKNKSLKTGGIIKANSEVKLNNTLGNYFYFKRTLSPMENFTPQYGLKGISTNPFTLNFGVSSAPDNKYYSVPRDNPYSKINSQQPEIRTGEIEYDKYNPIYHARKADYTQPVKLLGESLSFLTTDLGNKAVNRGRIAALNNSHFRVSGPASMNMKRSGMINTANAMMGNAQARNNSKGILGASSDIQTAMANKLYQEDMLNRNINEARLADGQQAHAEYMSQAELDRNVQAGRLDAENKNRMMTAELAKNIGLENSNYDLNKYNNISNYIKGLTKFAEEQPLHKAQYDYHHAMANPNLPGLKKYLLDHEAKKQEAMDSWQKRVSAARSRGDYSLQNSNFEDSAEYKGWKEIYDEHANQYKDLEHKLDLYSKTLNSAYLYNAKNAIRPQVTSQQKGGRIPLSEKIALENVRHKNRLKRQTEKEFYKQLLENNKAVQKAMVKVFK